MNELTVFNRNGQLYTDSRDVAKMIGKDHAHLMRDIAGYIETLNQSKIGFVDFFSKSNYKDAKGEIRPCYLITKKGCEFVANKLTGEKGVIFTAAYVNAFHAMEDKLNEQRNKFMALPQNYSSALRALADEYDKNKKLQGENAQQKQLISEQKPKVIFADAVSVSESPMLIGELAKILKQNGIEIGEKRLFEWMRRRGYLISRKGTDYNAPTQRAMEMGLFRVKETAISHSDGHVTVSRTTKVTGRGQQYFINKFIGWKTDRKLKLEASHG